MNRLPQHQESHHERISLFDSELEILGRLGIEEAQLEAIREAVRKLPWKRAREAYQKFLEEHPREAEILKRINEVISKFKKALKHEV